MNIDSHKIRALCAWLHEGRYGWVALAVTIATLVFVLRPHTPESSIRLAGLFLQVLGIGTVIWGISETRALFGLPPAELKLKDYFSRFPLIVKQKSGKAEVHGNGLVMVSGKFSGYGTHGAGDSPTVETRLEALEKNVATIHQRITQTRNDTEDIARKIENRLGGEENIRQSEDKAIRERLEASATGGVHISAIGALWLFVGVVLSTASVEIACLLTRF